MASYLVMKNNFQRSINRRGVFLITLLLPILFCLIAGAVNEWSETSVRLGVLGMENVTEKQREQTKEVLLESKNVTFEEADRDSVNTDLITGKYQMVADVRELFTKGVLQVDSNYSKEYEASLQQMISDGILLREAVDLSVFDEGATTKEERAVAFLVTIFLIFATLYRSEAIKDKANGLAERVHCSGVSRFAYGWGYDAYVFLMVEAQAAAACLVMQLVYAPSSSFLWILVIPSFIALVSTVYAKVICKLASSDASANITASSLAAVCSLLGGTFVAVENMPRILQFASVVSPIRWGMELMSMF